MQHTTFRFALDPTDAQLQLLARHAGAARFAYNQTLRLVTDALAAKRTDPSLAVPWSGFDLIKAFNAWKRSEAAGRVFVVAPDGTVTKCVTGLAWRHEVSAQVFEEAAVNLGRALTAFSQAKVGVPEDHQVEFPKGKRKGRCRDSFRLRNKSCRGGGDRIHVGKHHPRSVSLPTIGLVRVHDDTRKLRRLLRNVDRLGRSSDKQNVVARTRILFATVTRHGDRWYVSLNVQAPDLHIQRRHSRPISERGRFVGVDRGLIAFAVAATAGGVEVARFDAPKPLARRLGRLRRRSRAFTRTRPGSRNRIRSSRRLAKEHARIANIRRSYLHEVSWRLAKTHSRLAIENLAVAHLVRNKRLARAITDVGWAELARQLTYKVAWLDGELVVCDRWFASTKTCSACGKIKRQMGLTERTYHCEVCGLMMDRDCNAATNLATWAEAATVAAARVPDRQAGGRVINAPGENGADRRTAMVETASRNGEPMLQFSSERGTSEKGGRRRPQLRLSSTL
jgi:putative transposase